MLVKLMMATGSLLLAADTAAAAAASGQAAHTATVWAWLQMPIGDGAMISGLAGVAAWHGGLMLLAWLVLMPVALLVARFYKITPGQDWPRQLDNPFWFVNHRRFGYAIMLITLIALAVMVWDAGGVILWQSDHAVVGWAVIALGAFQIVGSLLRGTHGGPLDPFTRKRRPPEQWPGDHFSFTRRRVVFEYSHKLAGYFLLPLTVWTVADGLAAVAAPRWLWLVTAAWTIACAGAFVRLQRMGRCIDTYQAIWGPDENLPGNRRKPIGFGIRRPAPATHAADMSRHAGS